MSDPRERLPLPPHDFHVLLTLLEAPRHAYGLSAAAEEGDHAVRLEIGSLYRILARLTEQRLIERLRSARPSRGARGAAPLLPDHAVRPARSGGRGDAARGRSPSARKQKLLPSDGSR